MYIADMSDAELETLLDLSDYNAAFCWDPPRKCGSTMCIHAYFTFITYSALLPPGAYVLDS
jgi:hypothetical protein